MLSNGPARIMDRMDLFAEQRQAAFDRVQPLAVHMRPRSFNEFVGQRHFIGRGRSNVCRARHWGSERCSGADPRPFGLSGVARRVAAVVATIQPVLRHTR
jgi:hypothetical protein